MYELNRIQVTELPSDRLWHIVSEISTNPVEVIMTDRYKQQGAFSWNELMTTDAKAVKQCYTKLLGWTSEDVQIEQSEDHWKRPDSPGR